MQQLPEVATRLQLLIFGRRPTTLPTEDAADRREDRSRSASSASMDAQDSRLTEGEAALTCRQEERLPQKTRSSTTRSARNI